MSEDEIRKEFEAIISAPPFERDVDRFPNEPDAYSWPGSYRDHEIDLAWDVWRASRNAALEAATKVCADIAQKHLQSGSYVSVVADRAVRAGGQVDGAEECEKAIRALKEQSNG